MLARTLIDLRQGFYSEDPGLKRSRRRACVLAGSRRVCHTYLIASRMTARG